MADGPGITSAPERDSGARPRPGGSDVRFVAGWRGARGLLHGPFRTLVGGQVLGQFADGLAQISFAQLVLFDVGRGATPGRIAVVLAVVLLPFSVVGPLAGVLIDRWDRRRTLVVASWLRAALAALGIVAAVARSPALAYTGVLLMLSSSRFVLDAKGAVLPRTVAPEALVRANALSGLAGMSAAFVGAVGGAGFVAASSAAGFAAAGVAYAAAGLTFGLLPFSGGGHREVPLAGALRRLALETAAGVREVAARPELRRPLTAVWAHRLLLGAGFILLVLVADRRYHLSTPGYGLAVAVTGVGAFAGTVCVPWLVARWRPVALLPLAFLPPAAAALFAGYSPTLTGLLGAVAVTAVAFQCLKVLTDAIVGRHAPEALRGRVFALYDVLYNVTFVLAGLVMIPLWHVGQERSLIWWLGVAYLAGWLALSRVVRGWPFLGSRAPARRRTPARRRWAVRAAAVLAGAVPLLAFPTPGLWWLAWVGLVPWLLLIRGVASAREAAALGWWGAVGFLLAVHYWLAPSTGAFLLVIAALLSLLWMPWAVLTWRLLAPPVSAGRLAGALVLVPSGWLAIELARSWSALGGPWGLLGASQWRSPPMLAAAALGGVWLLSVLVVAANVAVSVLLTTRNQSLAVFATCAALGAAAVGPAWFAVQPRMSPAGTVRLAVIEAGVVHSQAARLDRQLAAASRLAPGSVDLVVLGESSVGSDLLTQPALQSWLQALAARLDADLLVNVDAAAPSGAIRKTSVLMGRTGILGEYSKMRLVPFGEYIPLRSLLGWLTTLTPAAATDRVRGHDIVVMRSGDLDLAPLVCFETSFPDLGRSAARAGAQLLVFQTATTTFQGSWVVDQLASLTAVRAAETGRPAVIAGLAGTSAAFDAQGRLLAWWPAPTGTMITTVPRAGTATPYDRFGDWVPAWALVALVASLALSAARHAAAPPERTAASADPARRSCPPASGPGPAPADGPRPDRW